MLYTGFRFSGVPEGIGKKGVSSEADKSGEKRQIGQK
jgi:hypothetical protein